MESTKREYLHALVERIPIRLVATATGVLEVFARQEEDPALRALANAPEDDESYTEEERELVAEAWEEVRRGETIPHKEIEREFGIS